jgi:hypothetical protein
VAGSPLTRTSATIRGAGSSRTRGRHRLLPRALVIAVALAWASALLTGVSAHAATTLAVNTLADNLAVGGECAGAPADCSLRQALDKAQSGDTVILPANAAPYLLEHEKIPIRGGVTIVGAGAGSSTISGGGAHQAFDLLAGPLITIANLTIDHTHFQPTGSENDQGGAINGEAKGGAELLLDGVTISNSDTASGHGGAVEINNSLTVRRSRFLNDSASATGKESVGGGAIDLLPGGSSLTISDSVFANNSAKPGSGGAVLVEDANTLSVSSSTFSSNIAAGGAPGGAIALFEKTTATIYNSTFTANAAGVGGAIASEAKQLALVGDTLSGNAAESGTNLAALAGKASA